ncbi:MAG TPA: LytR C-terminal domain-containing protein [Gaiellaceae bacterium]|nr:LytR C-terminal domain-containing protein [Gaiellaceae bacterium]
MDHPIRLDRVELAVRPWRTATVLIALVAAIELVLLIVAGGALLARSAVDDPRPAKKTKPAAAATVSTAAKTPAVSKAKLVPAELPRRKVRVLVLNGNGRQGAAASAAARVSQRGYRIGVVGNAARHDYAQSIVMYRRGFEGEGRRLASDLGVKVVGPLDGMRPGQLHGAHAVFILGA